MKTHHSCEAAELLLLAVQRSWRERKVTEVENVGDNKRLQSNPHEEECFGCEGLAWEPAMQRMAQLEQSRG